MKLCWGGSSPKQQIQSIKQAGSRSLYHPHHRNNASLSIACCHSGRTRTITTTWVEPHSWGQRASCRSCGILNRPSLITTCQPLLPSGVQRLHDPNFFIEIQNKSYLIGIRRSTLFNWTENITLDLDLILQNDLDRLCCGARVFPDFHSFIAVC